MNHPLFNREPPIAGPQNRVARTPSIKQLMLEIVTQLGPEIRARQLALDFDLDDVPIRGQAFPMTTAIQCLLSFAIEQSPNRSELSITLIDCGDHWELELAGPFDDLIANRESDGPTPNVVRLASVVCRDERLQRAEMIAIACGGDIEVWQCPQGGLALVLHVPQRRAMETVPRAA